MVQNIQELLNALLDPSSTKKTNDLLKIMEELGQEVSEDRKKLNELILDVNRNLIDLRRVFKSKETMEQFLCKRMHKILTVYFKQNSKRRASIKASLTLLSTALGEVISVIYKLNPNQNIETLQKIHRLIRLTLERIDILKNLRELRGNALRPGPGSRDSGRAWEDLATSSLLAFPMEPGAVWFHKVDASMILNQLLKELTPARYEQDPKYIQELLIDFSGSGVHHWEFAKKLAELIIPILNPKVITDTVRREQFFKILQPLLNIGNNHFAKDPAFLSWILWTTAQLLTLPMDDAYGTQLQNYFHDLSWMIAQNFVTLDHITDPSSGGSQDPDIDKKSAADVLKYFQLFVSNLIHFINIQPKMGLGLTNQVKKLIFCMPERVRKELESKLDPKAKAALYRALNSSGKQIEKIPDETQTCVQTIETGEGHMMETQFFEEIRRTFCPDFILSDDKEDKESREQQQASGGRRTVVYTSVPRSANRCAREDSLGGLLKFDIVMSRFDPEKQTRFFIEFNGTIFHYLISEDGRYLLDGKSSAKADLIFRIKEKHRNNVCIQISANAWDAFKEFFRSRRIEYEKEDFIKFIEDSIMATHYKQPDKLSYDEARQLCTVLQQWAFPKGPTATLVQAPLERVEQPEERERERDRDADKPDRDKDSDSRYGVGSGSSSYSHSHSHSSGLLRQTGPGMPLQSAQRTSSQSQSAAFDMAQEFSPSGMPIQRQDPSASDRDLERPASTSSSQRSQGPHDQLFSFAATHAARAELNPDIPQALTPSSTSAVNSRSGIDTGRGAQAGPKTDTDEKSKHKQKR